MKTVKLKLLHWHITSFIWSLKQVTTRLEKIVFLAEVPLLSASLSIMHVKTKAY